MLLKLPDYLVVCGGDAKEQLKPIAWSRTYNRWKWGWTRELACTRVCLHHDLLLSENWHHIIETWYLLLSKADCPWLITGIVSATQMTYFVYHTCAFSTCGNAVHTHSFLDNASIWRVSYWINGSKDKLPANDVHSASKTATNGGMACLACHILKACSTFTT